MKPFIKGISKIALDEMIKKIIKILRSEANDNHNLDFRRIYNSLGTAKIEGLLLEYLMEEIKDRHGKVVTELRKRGKL
jgi:hypothetical protein